MILSLFSKLNLSEKEKKYTIRTQHRAQRKNTHTSTKSKIIQNPVIPKVVA